MPETVPVSPSSLDAALALAALGYRVLPIKPGEKYPAMNSWQHAASTEPRTVSNWFTGMYRTHGVGIATGGDFFVLDVDDNDRHSGSAALTALELEHSTIPDTVTSVTGSGGLHYLLRVPQGYACPQNNQSGKVGDGLDIRGGGGQIVCAPTIHPNGKPYAWKQGHAPGEIEMATAPTWLMDLLAEPVAPAPTVTTPGTVSLRELVSGPSGDGPAARFDARTTWPQLLEGDGWSLDATLSNGEQRWTRPGKEGGTSATVGHNGVDCLKVFTSGVPGLQADKAYGRFGFMAARAYGGDESAAAHALLENEGRQRKTVDLASIVSGDELDAGSAPADPFEWLNQVDWDALRARDTETAEWLAEPIIASGRGHAIFAKGGTGKSLLAFWLALTIATGGLGPDGTRVERARVLYLDYEMTEDDLIERVEAMGFAEADLTWLTYGLLPSNAPADTWAGGQQIAAAAERDDVALVIIDTFSRAVEGDENDSKTTIDFYANTGRALKRAGRAMMRMDHSGKDESKGQRGSSAKNDDVDIVWHMSATDDGVKLLNKKKRTGWVPDSIILRIVEEPLRYEAARQAIPSGTARVIEDLDALGIGTDVTKRAAAKLLRDAGRKASDATLLAAQRTRRERDTAGLMPTTKRTPTTPTARPPAAAFLGEDPDF